MKRFSDAKKIKFSFVPWELVTNYLSFFCYDWISVQRLIPFPIFFCPFSQNWQNVFCWGYSTRKLGFLYSCKTLIFFFSEVNLVTVQNFRKKENEICWRLEGCFSFRYICLNVSIQEGIKVMIRNNFSKNLNFTKKGKILCFFGFLREVKYFICLYLFHAKSQNIVVFFFCSFYGSSKSSVADFWNNAEGRFIRWKAEEVSTYYTEACWQIWYTCEKGEVISFASCKWLFFLFCLESLWTFTFQHVRLKYIL